MGNRTETAVQVQTILTEMGCFIKTRLGIHDGSPAECTNTGLLILELMGEDADKKNPADRLRTVPEVKLELVELEL